jgi:Gas vesicle protein
VNEALVRQREVTLVDLVDRLLGGGVVVAGDITLAVADVDLVRVSLRALVASVDAVAGAGAQAEPRQPTAAAGGGR